MRFLNDIDAHFLVEQLFSDTFNENDATHLPLQVKMIWRPITEGLKTTLYDSTSFL